PGRGGGSTSGGPRVERGAAPGGLARLAAAGATVGSRPPQAELTLAPPQAAGSTSPAATQRDLLHFPQSRKNRSQRGKIPHREQNTQRDFHTHRDQNNTA